MCKKSDEALCYDAGVLALALLLSSKRILVIPPSNRFFLWKMAM